MAEDEEGDGMSGLVPSDGKEWLLLVGGIILGWYIVGHSAVTGSKTPPGMAG